ncbi:MAG: 2-hydroxyglutaryl-CoA dehydratase [Proteobacteria bacterium]|nr:2-hydroxyglutaryl-CoA dehydratase [Pseudomonadota bacterium]
MFTCGIDIGSRTIGAVIYDGERVIEQSVTDTGAAPSENAGVAYLEMLKKAGFKRTDISALVATGYGRNYFGDASRVVSEITCHAAGVAHYFPTARTVIDIGGQDSKMIQIGEAGRVTNFSMNDRCAAGTGKFIEMIAKTLDLPLDKTGALALTTNETCEISSMCAVFAESEIIGLLHRGVSKEIILRSVFKSVSRRTLSMAIKTGIVDEVVFTGGVARNTGVVEALKKEIDHEVRVPADPQITGALGAAIIAAV